MTKLDKIISWVFVVIAFGTVAMAVTLVFINDHDLMMKFTTVLCALNAMIMFLLMSGIFRGRNDKEDDK